MNVQQKKFKTGQLFSRICWMIVSAVIYISLEKVFIKIAIEDSNILTICKMILDASRIFFAEQLFRFVVIVIVRMDDKRDDFDSRFRIRLIEIIFVGLFIYSFRFHWNRSQQWVDIVVFILIFVHFLSGNSGYLNTLKVIELNVVRDYVYGTYKDMYGTAVRDVEQYNLKEQQLLEARKRYAESESEVNKAYRDQRSYVVENKLNPDFYQTPKEPPFKDYTGVSGLFFGKRDVYDYQSQVGQYIESLEKAFKNHDRRSRELQARMNDVNDAIRYVEGTEDEHQIELILGKGIDRSEKARNSYTKLNRRRFERKNRKY